MIPKSMIITLTIRYTILCAYILAIYGLVISALNNIFHMENNPTTSINDENVYNNCSIYHGIRRNTYIITGMSSIMWIGPLYWHIQLASTQWNILCKDTLSIRDKWVLKYRTNYVYYNIWLFLFSMAYLPNIAMQLPECNTPLTRKLIAIHSLNIIPVTTQFGLYFAKLSIAVVLALSIVIKRLMFKTFTGSGWYLHRSVTGDFTLLQEGQTPVTEPTLTSRSVHMNTIAGNKHCTICMEDQIPVMVTLECKHEMCISCCKEWLETHTTCPFCRDNLAAPKSSSVVVETIDV